LKISEKSVALKHYVALSKIVDLDLEHALVIEDDVIFSDMFLYKLNNIINSLPNDWDVYFPNSVKNMFDGKYTNINNDLVIRRHHPSTAYCISYLINKKCCKNIIYEIENNKIVLPIDFEYNWIFYKLNLNVYFNKQHSITSCANFESSIGH
jgi:GR25 family glycosyltransferase involved in LPS biosynthesis